MRLLSYCIRPNHWHLVLYPKNDGDMGLFMGWLTNTHTDIGIQIKILSVKAIFIMVDINHL